MKKRTPRKKGMRLGGQLMFIALVLTPIFFGLCFAVDAGEPLLVPATIFFAGLCWMLYARIFADDTAYVSPTNHPPQFSNTQPNSFMLFPDRRPLASLDPRRMNTADLPQSSGVTDHTTQLFD
ncbi:MAG: hypothetical protein WAV20_18660 [Blastocatellia bacterium]